jgi:transposase
MGPDRVALASGKTARAAAHFVDLRAVTDAIHYIASSRCQRRMLPKDFPPVFTVRG